MRLSRNKARKISQNNTLHHSHNTSQNTTIMKIDELLQGNAKLPLRVVTHTRYYPLCSISDARGRIIADVGGDSPDERENNTALLVHAVNMLSKLIEALEGAMPLLTDQKNKYPAPEWDNIYREFRDLLNEATNIEV